MNSVFELPSATKGRLSQESFRSSKERLRRASVETPLKGKIRSIR